MFYKWCVLVAAALSAWTAHGAVIANDNLKEAPDAGAEVGLPDQETRPQVEEADQLCLGGGAEGDNAAELSLESGLNASGHWLAKVRLQHVMERPGEVGEQGVQSPVQLQMRRSTRRGHGDSRLVTLQATLTGPAFSSSFPAGASASSLDHRPGANGSLPCPVCPTLPPNRDEHPLPSCPPPAPCPACATPLPLPPTLPACPSPCPAPAPCPVCPAPPTQAPITCPSPCPSCPACPAPSKCPSPCPTPPPCPACPSCAKPTAHGYERHAGLGAYRVHLAPLNWLEAKATCEREGAHLAVINSQEEANTIARILASQPIAVNYVSMGFHDLFSEGDHYTVLDKPVKLSGYNKWNKGEPNNLDNEDCGGFSASNMGYNDHQCNDILPFICEMP
ncbi:hypothetical protein R5R35_005191 [Gryllus longicercus]|uniref:C-type lectin domain-containing protein n=1 Tax=Gryllus longicercus TaxID=2509291 RepID=A0AAN9ZFT0_9ORTH